MKMVTVETCIQCKQQCARGLAYIEKMMKPGTIGQGVPCILTKGNQVQDKNKKKQKEGETLFSIDKESLSSLKR